MKPAGDRVRILLIEDDAEDAELFREMLADWKLHRFELTVAADLGAAAARLREPQPDVVVTDLGLGASQGLDTLTAVRQLAGQVPVVVLTGLDELSSGLRAIEMGAQSYLEKGRVDGRQAAQTILHAIQRAQTLRALQAARRKAEATQAARTRFFATLSHELRQPLNGILGYVQLLEIEPEAPRDKRLAYCGAVRNSVDLMLGLINDILDYAKVEAGHLQLERRPSDLLAAMQEAIATIAPMAAQRQVRIDLALAPEPAARLVEADSRRLVQVFINLLSNAVRFSPAGSIVTVRSASEGPLRGCAIGDRGPGMTASELAVALEPFGQVHGDSSGTGLGLPFCQRLVDLHGGRMRIDTARDRGTVVAVLLPPAASEDPEPAAERVAAAEC